MADMISLGVANKDMQDSYYGCCPSPCPPDDDKKKAEWEDTVTFPKFTLEGKQAELMGCDDCQTGDLVEVTLKLRVSGKRDDSRLVDGKAKRDVSLTFEVLETGNLTDMGRDNDADTKADEGKTDVMDSAPVRALMGMDDGDGY